MRRLPGALLAGWLWLCLVSLTAAEAPGDPIFKALQDELQRSLSLHLEGLEAPFFVQYEVEDAATYRVGAANGALLNSEQSHSRVLHSQVRVGSYQLDNSNFAGRGGRSGLGDSAALPLDDDYLALRHAIWWATDAQYKQAVETLTQKRAYMKDRNVEDRPPDFTKAGSLTAVQELAHLAFNRPAWENYVRRISEQFQKYAPIQNADVSLVSGVANRYLLNSEGARLRDGQTETLLRITVEAQAEDGQRLSDFLSFYAPAPEQLPSLDEVVAQVGQLAERLSAAVKAPVLEDYTGPVLFDGLASVQLFRQLLARGLTGQPDPVGGPRRTAQGGDDLENRVGKRILPQTFQIYDDPRESKYENWFLAGHYLYDDEAKPAERVNIVVDGKLESMAMSRTPTKLFAQSNGHGRRGGGETPRSALGCLYIESSKGLSPEDLKKELLDAADAEGLKFGLRVAGIQSRAGGVPGGRFGRGGGRAGGRVVGDPIAVYKVYVADGHEEPVRGCEFTSLDLPSLRKITAAGRVRVVQNSVIGTTPSSSIIAPAVLLPEIELSKSKVEAERKPLLEAPGRR